MNKTKKIDHMGIRIELIGKIGIPQINCFIIY